MTDLPFLSDLERLAKAAIAIRQNLDARFATSATDVLSLIAALREAEGDAKCYSDAAKMWREQCEEARARLSSIRSAMLSEEAVKASAKKICCLGGCTQYNGVNCSSYQYARRWNDG